MVDDVAEVESYEAEKGGVREEADAVRITNPDGGWEEFEGFEVGCTHGQEGKRSPITDYRCCSSGGRKGRNRFLSMAFM